MSRKASNLAELALKKTAPSPTQPSTTQAPSAAGANLKRKRKGQTLRLEEGAWKQLKYLAVDKSVSSHELLLEAVNDLFQKYGKAPIA